MFTLFSPETINSPLGNIFPFLFGKANGPFFDFREGFFSEALNLIGRVDTSFVGSKNNGYDS